MEEVREWLKKIKLSEYANAFERAGYDDMETIMNLEPEDLKEIGMQKAGGSLLVHLPTFRSQKKGSGNGEEVERSTTKEDPCGTPIAQKQGSFEGCSPLFTCTTGFIYVSFGIKEAFSS